MDDLKRALRLALYGATFLLVGCATVRPEDRAILADPVMQYHLDARAHAAFDLRFGFDQVVAQLDQRVAAQKRSQE